jgi:hypothetical protein
MGLDVYVGSLTRYYAESPLAVVERIARQQGVPFTAEAGGADHEDAIRVAILRWRDGLGRWLGDRLPGPLEWDESREAACFTDKPGWEGYGGTLLLAAHDEHPELPLPAEVSAEWSDDPAYQASLAAGPNSRYDQLLGPELWLPCRFDFTVRTQDATGHPVEIGSSVSLLDQLEALRARRGLAGSDADPPDADAVRAGGSLVAAARAGLDHLLRLAAPSWRWRWRACGCCPRST